MPAVRLLSTPSIFLGEEKVEVPQGKTSALLYYLAYQADWVSREDFLYLFWPDTEERKARRNLRQLLSSIRQLPFTQTLETTEHSLRWLVPSDAQVFKDALEKKQWARAVECYGGPLLAGFKLHKLPEFESWLELERSSLLSHYREAVFSLSERLELDGHYLQAADYMGQLHDFEPFDEHVLQHYLKLLAWGEKRYKALDIYERFTTTLALELDTEPSADMQTLIATIRSGDALETKSLKGAVSSNDALTQAQKRMPIPSTHFVGRETEIAQLIGLLHDPACRLLTLVAAGGMGKTRLAIEVAGRLKTNFANGICFVPFEAVSSPELMVTTVAEAINFTFLGQQDPKEQLLNYLKPKQMLLVADNLEHLTEGVSLLSELLDYAPDIVILATSRQTLNLHAEWLYDVTGMSVAQTPSQTNDAVNLFLQSAKKATGKFQLSEQNHDAVINICERVGGMPLAIELAASWLRVLTPQAIVDELGKGLEPLSGATRDMPERHHSIRTVFESSWQRLKPSEQTALKHLAVFQGGFNRETTERVAQLSLPLLLSLSNKSFLRRDDTGRFTQHPLMWQFAREKADSDSEFDAVKESHASYFATFLKAREEGHERLHAKTVRQEITLELPNILEAWHWIVENGREDFLEQALWSLREYYRGESRFYEGEALFSEAQKRLSKNSLMRARLLHTLGLFNNLIGTYDRGANLIQESLELSKKHGSLWDEAHARLTWALNQGWAGATSMEESVALYREAADLFRQAGDVNQEARCLVNVAMRNRNPEERAGMLRRSAAVFRETEHYSGLTLALLDLADMTAHTLGDFEEAVSLFDEVLEIERKRDVPFGVWCLCGSGNALVCQGNYPLAKERFEESLNISQHLNALRGIISPENALYGLGWLALLQGNYPEAEMRLREALALNRSSFDPTGTAFVLNALSRLAFTQGQLDEALAYCDEIDALLTRAKRRDSDWWETKLLRHHNLADIALAQGDTEGAGQYLRAALVIAREWHFLPLQLNLLFSYAELVRRQGDDAQAATLLVLIAAHKASIFATRKVAAKWLDTLPEGVRVSGLEQSKTLGLEQIIKEILLD